MPLNEFLKMIRQPYLEVLSKAASAAHAHIEPAFRRADGDLATEGLLDLPCRADIVHTDGELAGQSVSVDADSRVTFEELKFELDKTSIVYNPFSWDCAEIEALGLQQDIAFRTFKSWFMDWFDLEDQNNETEEGLYGVVHYISDPKMSERGGWRVTVDFGSAPIETMEDLMNRFADVGATELRVG